jgi:hypothetical protein
VSVSDRFWAVPVRGDFIHFLPTHIAML